MANKVLYTFPEKQETKNGHLFIDKIKYREIVKDPVFETEQEIDLDFPNLENYVIRTIVNNFYYEHHFTLNSN